MPMGTRGPRQVEKFAGDHPVSDKMFLINNDTLPPGTS